jgi:hypothetical protein
MSQLNPSPVINPYAAPQIAGGYVASQPLEGAFPGLWRQGHLLVMHKQAPLPPICLKSGQPATQWLKRKMQWHEPWIVVTVVAGVLIYAILALIMTKRATLIIGLCDEWAARRRTRILIALCVTFFAIAVGTLGIALGSQGREHEGWFGLLGLALVILIGAALYGQYACRLIWPQRISDQYVWVNGVHPSFLDQLPIWTYGVV